jgi:hypothetical protein
MIVRHFKIPIEYPINFIQIKLKNANNDYFINKIKNNIDLGLSYKTNVHGKMTKWKAFNEDKNFLELLNLINRNYKLDLFNKMELQDAWGIMMEPNDETVLHNHGGNMASGIIYLNDCNNKVLFPQIDTEVIIEKNTCLIFSGLLDHCATPILEGTKFAIAFNLKDVKEWKDYE